MSFSTLTPVRHDDGMDPSKPRLGGPTRPTAEQAEIARLTRQLDLAERRLSRTEAALSIMGKAQALLEEISESAQDRPAPKKR